MSLSAQISCREYFRENIALLNVKLAYCSEMFCLTSDRVNVLRVQCGMNVFSETLPCYSSRHGYESHR